MKVISGGQTGADLGGLQGAMEAGIETGGLAPAGYRTENGPNPELRNLYGLEESIEKNYNHRTIENVKNSDATALFADDLSSPGTVLTIQACEKYDKTLIINPNVEQLRIFAAGLRVLNIAGNRESKAPGLQARVRAIVAEALKPDYTVTDDRWVE